MRSGQEYSEDDDSVYSKMSNMDLCLRLKEQDADAWRYVLKKVVSQEKCSYSGNRKRADWSIPLDSLISRLYDEMIGGHKLDAYRGNGVQGSLIGWFRKYVRGYLNRENPAKRREISMDCPLRDGDEGDGTTLADAISFNVSDFGRGCAYGGEDDQIALRERRRIARRCFRELWLGNSMQAYVMLLKARFQMSSLEIMERLGASSADNVDQMFARAVKKMRQAKEKYDD